MVAPDAAPKLLTPLAVKADIIAGLGVKELVVIPFDGAFAAQTPQEFIDDVLVAELGATQIRVGENFRFGHRALGDVDLLRAEAAFETTVAEMVEVDGEIVSSTHIRGLVVAGEVEKAARFLGLPFHLRGIVQHGDKRGRTLGFPTANLVPDNASATPATGSTPAAPRSSADGEWDWWPAAVSIGVRPTFVTGRGVLIEALPDRLRRRLLRQGAAAGRSSSASGARSASTRPRRWWSRCTPTTSARARSPDEAGPARRTHARAAALRAGDALLHAGG